MSSRTLGNWLCAMALATTATLVPIATRAQTAIEPNMAISRFSPSPAGDRFFGVQSPFVAGDGVGHAMLLFDYAYRPLVLRRTSDGTDIGDVVSNQWTMHLNGTLAMWHRLNINLDVPIVLAQNGDDPTVNGTTFVSPSGAAFGDVRIGARLRIFGEYYDPFQLAVGGYLWTPTGPEKSYVSDNTVRGMPFVGIGGYHDWILWSLVAGADIRRPQDFADSGQGTMIRWGAGLGFLVDDKKHLQVGPELTVTMTPRDLQKRTVNAEILAGGRYRVIDDLEVGLAVGPGLSYGTGTPVVRLVTSVAYTPKPEPAPADRDRDGIVDAQDACPDTPGVRSENKAKHGCPPSCDKDGDGIVDGRDACPETPGIPSENPQQNGCPRRPGDRDQDGIFDADDACPDKPGIAHDNPEKHGCPPPPDRDEDGVIDVEDACPGIPGPRTNDPATTGCPDQDGDGIPDHKDACPKQKGLPNADPTKHGCPDVVVTAKEIVILEKVEFDTGKATIKSVSFPLLDKVANVLKKHTEFLLVEVQGHTDNRGTRQMNIGLSQRRAKSVRQALISRGIAADRLSSKGYGPDKPVADNKTDEGRQQNRRVQFKILKKKK